MSLRAAAQVAMETLKGGGAHPGNVQDSIGMLEDGLIDDRARSEGPVFYKLAVALFESQMNTAAMSDTQLRLFSKLREVCHEVKNGTPE